MDGYQQWIQLVAEFTLTSLQSWQWASSSVYYLLTLWSRLISSVPYLKGEAPSMLDAYVPRITETFITTRLDSVTAVARGGGTRIRSTTRNGCRISSSPCRTFAGFSTRPRWGS